MNRVGSTIISSHNELPSATNLSVDVFPAMDKLVISLRISLGCEQLAEGSLKPSQISTWQTTEFQGTQDKILWY